MTAFARAEAEAEGLTFRWELRSVNHRFLEAHFRLPEQLRGLEGSLRDTLRGHLARGKVDCTLRVDAAATAGRLALNRPLLLQILATLEQVRRDAPEIGPPSAVDILRWPGMLSPELELDADALAAPVSAAFEASLSELIAHRRREGEALRETVIDRLDAIDGLVDDVARQTEDMADQIAARLRARLQDVSDSVDPGRLEQEVVLLAGRGDVAEELDRLRVHVEEARANLRAPGPHGRRLDFLTQELNREANTLGAKAVLAETSQRAVDLKLVIEQIREQVQNLE